MKMPKSIARPGQDDLPGKSDSVTDIMAAMIRERSAAAQLTTESEILCSVHDDHLMHSDADQNGMDGGLFLERLIHENEDLRKMTGDGPSCYYSSLYMTESYAQILFHKQDGPLPLIAETVRRHTRIYQRPISLDMFTQPPFSLDSRQVRDALTIMAETDEYGDIAETLTSADSVYLYSTSHLEAEHAAMLAEWLDVGQYENP